MAFAYLRFHGADDRLRDQIQDADPIVARQRVGPRPDPGKRLCPSAVGLASITLAAEHPVASMLPYLIHAHWDGVAVNKAIVPHTAGKAKST